MSDISKETLKKEIAALLKSADLTKTSAKKIRQELEKKLDADLDDRKKEIDVLVMDAIKKAKANKKNGKGDSDDENDEDEEAEDEEDEDEEEEEEVKPAKKAAPPKRKKRDTSEESGGSDDDDGDKNDGDYSPKKGAAKKKAPAGKRGRKKKDDSDSDDDWKTAKKAAKKSGAKRGNSAYTKAIKLSPELSSLMGAEALPRHEVVKKIWAIIKEKNLYDPSNKQYAICDDDLMKVIGVKRFRTFGMMKYLKTHFIP
ncbi:uncharacterized protein LOC126843810 isoform X2 [Adelges cooleyi]|uniref:uncharacterized protein LOC126843810 isoform X2 n=1 Tax=Adelges cooleyi TaxID=133065 RepID=UPI00217F7103|nr:uncharacterized protein LOC126843810 isoform X2 [Adelges cooleyi]